MHGGAAPYKPNSLDGGNPFAADENTGAYVEVPRTVESGPKVRRAPASFDDHFSQVRLFWKSLTPVEQEHVIRAYTFELGKCYEQAVKERQLQCLANVDTQLCSAVAEGLGLPVPEPTVPMSEPEPSPALSQLGRSWPTDGRMVAVAVDDTSDLEEVSRIRDALLGAGLLPLVLAPKGGTLADGTPVQRTLVTARSVEFDAVVLTGAMAPQPDAVPARDAKGRLRGRRHRPPGPAAPRRVVPARQGGRGDGARHRGSGGRGALRRRHRCGHCGDGS